MERTYRVFFGVSVVDYEGSDPNEAYRRYAMICNRHGSNNTYVDILVDDLDETYQISVQVDGCSGYVRKVISPKEAILAYTEARMKYGSGSGVVRLEIIPSLKDDWRVLRGNDLVYRGCDGVGAKALFMAVEVPSVGVVRLMCGDKMESSKQFANQNSTVWMVIRGDRVLYHGVSEMDARNEFLSADLTQDGPEAIVVLEKDGSQVGRRHGWFGPAWTVFRNGQVAHYGHCDDALRVYSLNDCPLGTKVELYENDKVLVSRIVEGG